MKTLLFASLLCLGTAAVAQDAGAESTERADPNAPNVAKLPFTQDSIKAVVAYHQPKIQGCYNEMLAARKNVVEGKLMTSWVITGEGLVKKPKVEKKGTTFKDAKLTECVIAVLSAMEFPKPADSRDHPIEYPFNLKAEK